MAKRRAVLSLRDERPAWAPDDATLAAFADAFGDEWEVIDVQTPVTGRADGGGVSDESVAAAQGAEVWIGYGLPRPVLDTLLAEPSNFRWIHTASAGVRSLLHDELKARDVLVSNSAGIHAEPMADTVLAAIHYFARGFDHAVHAQRRGEWDPTPFEQDATATREIAGSTLAIVGYGGIGRAIAARAQALDMRVVAHRRSTGPAMEDGVEIVRGDDGLDELLERADYVALTLPSTPETEGMIDRRRLERMRSDSVLISVGRGDVLDEPALCDLLAQRRLRGAALDVFVEEPLPADSPLWTLPNALVLPHVSPTTNRFWEREAALILENIRAYLADEEMRNVVDLERGY